jgi:hypothetical protein
MNTKFGVINFPVGDPRVVPLFKELNIGFLRVNVQWGDIERRKGVYSWAAVDKILSYRRMGFDICLTVITRNRLYATAGYSTTMPHRAGKPNDLAAYQRFIAALLKRVGPNIAFLQIDNEVSEDGIYWAGTVENYLSVLRRTRDAVNSYKIPIALAGIASEATELLIEGDTLTVHSVSSALSSGLYDVVDLHLYHRVESIAAKVEWFHDFGIRRIIATEVSGPDIVVDPWSEKEKCLQLERRFDTLQVAGVERMCWFSFVDLSNEAPRFRRQGLVSPTGIKHAVFDTYRRYIARTI